VEVRAGRGRKGVGGCREVDGEGRGRGGERDGKGEGRKHIEGR
jgi:hypothetical protein